MQTSEPKIIQSFVELAQLIESCSTKFLYLTEFLKFYNDINSKCECDQMSNINRCLNYYQKLPTRLTQEEINFLIEKSGKLEIILMFQGKILHVLKKTDSA